MNVDDETVMRELSRISLEPATQSLADFARRFAEEVPRDMSGRDAMIAFANAIENTNGKVWRTGTKQ